MTAAELLSTRLIGDAEVTVFHSGLIHWHPHFAPGQDWVTHDTVTDDEGRVVLGVNGLLIRTGDDVVLVDPNSFTPETPIATAELVPGATIDAVLDAVGVRPDEVTAVLITHGHDDHFSAIADDDGAVRFPNARHFFPTADWQRFVRDDATGHAEQLLALLGPVERAGLLELVAGEARVADGLTLVPTPGETEGHQIVRLERGNERLYYLGDLFHMPIEFAQLDWLPVTGRDVEQVVASRRRLFADAEGADATMVFMHGRFPGWGVVERTGPDAWAWRYTEKTPAGD
jgi:glyoxylase-like metal-dependent hydrolase (beta-lactamase superfamily II)